MDLDFLHRTAIAAAYKGARVLQSKFGNIHDIREKDAREIVTEADTESEKAIVAVIHARFPDHEILGEECGFQPGASPYRWIIDPLDGTVNFAWASWLKRLRRCS